MILRRSGNKANDKRKDLRICDQHKLEWETFNREFTDGNGKTYQHKFMLNLPVSVPIDKNEESKSNGLGTDRSNKKFLKKMKKNKNTEARSWIDLYQKTMELITPSKKRKMNEDVASTLDVETVVEDEKEKMYGFKHEILHKEKK